MTSLKVELYGSTSSGFLYHSPYLVASSYIIKDKSKERGQGSGCEARILAKDDKERVGLFRSLEAHSSL